MAHLDTSATYEEVIPGDFVHHANGGPLGLVESMEDGLATVLWFDKRKEYSVRWEWLRPIGAR